LPYGGSTVALRFCDIFASRKIARCPYDFYDHCTAGHLTMFARLPHGARAICTIVRAPVGHPEVPVRRPQSVSSKIYKRRAQGRSQKFILGGYNFLLHDTTVLYTSSLTTSAAISAQNNFQGLILGRYIYRYTPLSLRPWSSLWYHRRPQRRRQSRR